MGKKVQRVRDFKKKVDKCSQDIRTNPATLARKEKQTLLDITTSHNKWREAKQEEARAEKFKVGLICDIRVKEIFDLLTEKLFFTDLIANELRKYSQWESFEESRPRKVTVRAESVLPVMSVVDDYALEMAIERFVKNGHVTPPIGFNAPDTKLSLSMSFVNEDSRNSNYRKKAVMHYTFNH